MSVLCICLCSVNAHQLLTDTKTHVRSLRRYSERSRHADSHIYMVAQTKVKHYICIQRHCSDLRKVSSTRDANSCTPWNLS